MEEELAGRDAGLKAYSIAIDALGKPENYDPSVDPAVRLVASRTRAALKDFFETDEGWALPLRIELPKGTYRPLFIPQASADVVKESVRNKIQWNKYFLGLVAGFFFLAAGLLTWSLQKPVKHSRTVMPQVAFQVEAYGGESRVKREAIRQRGLHALAQFGQPYVAVPKSEELLLSDEQISILVKVVLPPDDAKGDLLFEVILPHENKRLSSSKISASDEDGNLALERFDDEISRVFSQNGAVFTHLDSRKDISADTRCILGALRNRTVKSEKYRLQQITCFEKVRAENPELGLAAVQLSAFFAG